jgi:hypothetical protein
VLIKQTDMLQSSAEQTQNATEFPRMGSRLCIVGAILPVRFSEEPGVKLYFFRYSSGMMLDPKKAEVVASRVAGTGAFILLVAVGLGLGLLGVLPAICALGAIVFLFGLSL